MLMKIINNSGYGCSVVLVLCAFSGVSWGVESRVDSATQQVERTNLNRRFLEPAADVIPSLYKDESKDLGPQYMVKEAPPKQPWIEASFDYQYASSTNVNLLEKDQSESSLMISTAQIALTPSPWELADGSFALKTGYRHQKFNYGVWTKNEHNLNDADFDVSSLFLQGRYMFHEKWVFATGLDYNRLLTAATGKYDEFYAEFVPSVSLERSFAIDNKSMVTASLGGNLHITRVDSPNTDHNDRVDEVLLLSYIRELTPAIAVQPFYRAQFTQYTRGSRKDILQTVGLTVSYAFSQWASARVYTNYEARESGDGAVADYRKLDTGIGVSFQVRF